MSDVLPFGRLWYDGPNAIANAVGYATHYSRSADAVIRVYDAAVVAIVVSIVRSIGGYKPPFPIPQTRSTFHPRTMKRFPSSRCASAIQIVRPLESIAETQPRLQPALLRLSATISQSLHAAIVRVYDSAGNVIETHEHAGDFKEW